MLAVTISASADGYITASDLRGRLRLLDTMFKTNKGQPADFSNAGIGMGYVLAISDANDGTLTCAPSNAKGEQLAATVLKFIDDKPDDVEAACPLGHRARFARGIPVP